MEKIFYCRQWFRHDKIPTEPLDEDLARIAHNSRTLYTILIGSYERPRCFVECNMDYIGVEFLDQRLREYTSYQFQELRPGMLFLSMAVFRCFERDSNQVVKAVVYYFGEDGSTSVDKSDLSNNEAWEAKTTLDVSANWEPYPQFGDYESITRLERGLALIHEADFIR